MREPLRTLDGGRGEGKRKIEEECYFFVFARLQSESPLGRNRACRSRARGTIGEETDRRPPASRFLGRKPAEQDSAPAGRRAPVCASWSLLNRKAGVYLCVSCD